MESTPLQTQPPLNSSATKSKLPIKRKTLHSSPNPNSPSPNPFSSPNPPSLIFHRIWTEPDELRFLRGLIDSTSEGLQFPRDLHLFHRRFTTATSQPYTLSQLSDKLRRLRKKFRVLSTRHARGVAFSPHDRALFDLSGKLWRSPEFAEAPPNVGRIKVVEDAVVGDGVVSLPIVENPNLSGCCDSVGIEGCGFCGGKIGGVVAKIVLDVFDQCLKEAKMRLLWKRVMSVNDVQSSQNVDLNFGKRWQEQLALELDVFARHWSLVIENSLNER